MNLKTKRLLLREYRPEDWARVHIYGSSREFTQYEMWGPNDEVQTKDFIARAIENSQAKPRSNYEMAVCLPDDTLIGGCGLRQFGCNSGEAAIGWAINPEFQNNGYCTEAAQALINYGFENLQLKLIYATCDTRNIPSQKVMEKLGMKRVAHMKKDRKIYGKVLDSYRYEIATQKS